MSPVRAAFAATPILALAIACAPMSQPSAVPVDNPALADPEVETRTANDGNVVLEGIPAVPSEMEERVNRYQNVRSAGLADWTADGSGIYISTRFADVSQLHRVDRAGGARHQLTFFREPALFPTRRPGSDEILLGMDEGGSEFWQLFLFDPGTGESRRLTDGESRNSNPRWSPDGSRFTFTSTRRDGRSNDVWVMEPADTAGARLLVRAEGGANWGVADWSPDGRRVLVTEYVSINDSYLHLVDVETGEMRRIAGSDEELQSWIGFAPTFARDGSGIFVATDAMGEFRQLARLEPETGEAELITADIPWDVEELALSEDGRRAAFVVNEHGYGRLYLMDPATGRHEPARGVPDGLISGLTFRPDGGALAMTISAADLPSDVFVLELGGGALAHAGLERWTHSELGGLDPAGFVAPELVEYESFDGRMIPAFVYRPAGAGPHPVIVQIHGGPESQSRPGFAATYQMWMDEVGAAIVRPNVRGSSGYGKEYLLLDNAELREESVYDIGALLDWIAAQPDLDEERVMVYGGSYGGYMVLASLVHYSDRLAGGVNIVGISNFVTFLENTQGYRRDLRRAEYGDERDPAMRAHLEAISPTTNAHRIEAPLFVAQGDNDPRVPASESRQIVDVVRANDRPVWYMNALNEGHGFRRRDNQDLFAQLVLMFFEEQLGGAGRGSPE